MSAIAAMSLVTFNKGTFAYTPMGDKNNIFYWADTSGGIPLGYGKISISNKSVNAGASARNKVKALLEIPVLSQPSGTNSAGFTPAAIIGHTLRATIEFDFHNSSTLVQRDTIHQILTELIKDGQFTDILYTLSQPY